MIEQLKRLDTDLVKTFLELRDHQRIGIPEKLASYILELNAASNLRKEYRSITDCAKQLQKAYPHLSIATCKQRIYDSINYLHSDCNVTSSAWNMLYADEMENLADINLLAHSFKEARICKENARLYRLEASAGSIDPNRVKFKPIIVSPDIELERMGIKSQGLLNAHKVLISFISGRDIPDIEKHRLAGEASRELNVEEASYENL